MPACCWRSPRSFGTAAFHRCYQPPGDFPGADRLGWVTGDPLVAPAYQQGEQLGSVFLTLDFMNTTGYSGKPIHQLVAMDMQGVIRKVLLVEHHEPIVRIGIPEKRIIAVLKDYEGLDVGKLVRGTQDHNIDIVTGATVTVMDDTILLSAIKVARLYGLSGLRAERKPTGPVAVNQDINEIEDWLSLISDGSVRRLKINLKQINRVFEDSGNPPALDFPEEGEADEVFIELYAAVDFIPSIGRSLPGENEYRNLSADMMTVNLIPRRDRLTATLIPEEATSRFHHKSIKSIFLIGEPYAAVHYSNDPGINT